MTSISTSTSKHVPSDVIGFDRQVVLEQAVYAELSALARTAPGKTRAHSGFRPLDPPAVRS